MTEQIKFSRKCDNCKKGMNEGFCWGDGAGYACSDECLYVDGYTKEQFDKDCNEDTIYWTEWEEIDEDGFYTESGEWIETQIIN